MHAGGHWGFKGSLGSVAKSVRTGGTAECLDSVDKARFEFALIINLRVLAALQLVSSDSSRPRNTCAKRIKMILRLITLGRRGIY